MGGVEIVVADVGKTDVVAQLGIEELILYATTQTEAAVEAVEAVVVERAVGLAVGEILDLACHTDGQIATSEGLDGAVGGDGNGVFHEQGHLEIVKAIGELGTLVASLAALLDIRQASLEEDGRVVAQLEPDDGTDVEAGLQGTAIEVDVVGTDRRESSTEAETVVDVGGVVMAGGCMRTRRVIIAGPAILCEGRHGERKAQQGNR